MRLKNQMAEPMQQAWSPYIEKIAHDIQYDVVGWTLYCREVSAHTKETTSEKVIDVGAPPKGPKKSRQKDTSRPSTGKKDPRPYRFLRESLKEIYGTKDHYKTWLSGQYRRDIDFYKAILKDRSEHPDIVQASKEGMFDSDLEAEVDATIQVTIRELEAGFKEETRLIDGISDSDWGLVAASPYPKVTLALVLGLDIAVLRQGLSDHILARMRAQSVGQRTAYLTGSGPRAWRGIEEFDVQKDLFVESILEKAQTPKVKGGPAGLLGVKSKE